MFTYQGQGGPDLQEGLARVPQDIYEESATALVALGTKRVVGDQVYRYAKAGSSALTAGKLLIHPSVVDNHQNVAVAAVAAIGANAVTVTLGATLATLNQYADGYLVISDADGEGAVYRIKSNPAAAASATLTLTLYDALYEALAVTSECCLIPNLYNGVVESIADQLDIPAGVPIKDVTASYYFWMLTGGIGPVLSDETVAQGQQLTIGSSVTGAVEAQDAAGEAVVGYAIMALVDEEYRPIYFTLDKV